MKNLWMRKIFTGLSFTSTLFIFQACYGTDRDFGLDLLIEGQVKSSTTGLPIPGIQVAVANNMQYQITDDEGKFSFYTEMQDSLKLQIQDIDSVDNNQYLSKDTVLTDFGEQVYLDIVLIEK